MDRKPYLPEFHNSVFEGYAVGYLNKNFWRFTHTFGDFEDALSEACIVFYECRRLYGSKVNSRAHFMALYKRMMWSWFTDWANYDTQQRNTMSIYRIEETTQQDGPLATKLSKASSELKQVIQIIFNAPAEVLSILRKDAQEGGDQFFNHAVQLCNLPLERALPLKGELIELLG